MEDHYRINVARAAGPNWDGKGYRYEHFFFAQVRDEASAKQAYAELQNAFPAPQYQVSVTKWTGRGQSLSWS